jgi:hypothetical protein
METSNQNNGINITLFLVLGIVYAVSSFILLLFPGGWSGFFINFIGGFFVAIIIFAYAMIGISRLKSKGMRNIKMPYNFLISLLFFQCMAILLNYGDYGDTPGQFNAFEFLQLKINNQSLYGHAPILGNSLAFQLSILTKILYLSALVTFLYKCFKVDPDNKTNNKVLSDNQENEVRAASSSGLPLAPTLPSQLTAVPLIPQTPPPPLPTAGMIQKVDFIDPNVSKEKNKKAVILAVSIAAFFFVIYGIFIAKAFRKDARNIKVSGDQMSMSWKGMDISAKLASKGTISFMTNGGQMDSRNTGLFGVIPMEKVKYLKQKYTDFIHCDSPGESEAKSLEYNIEIFTNTATAEVQMSKINDLVKKGNLVVFEVDGSQLQQMQQIQAEKSNPIMSPQLFFYLVDDVRIIDEKYQ